MDLEGTKLIVPLLAGAMALAGGIFTFVNGRLIEAKTTNARRRVVGWTLSGLSTTFLLAGLFTSFLNSNLWPLALFAVGFAFQITLLLRQSGPVQRIELLTFCLVCCGFTLFTSITLTLHFTGRILGVVEKMTEVLKALPQH